MSAAASKKKDHLTKVCRIFQWIEGKDERFASAIRNLCMEGALSPGHSSPGLTFLYPEDAAYRAEICDKAYSDDADSAVAMIKALIIPDALHNASDFSRRPVGSDNGVLYEVEGTSGDVKLKGGVTLKKADDFHLLRHKDEAKNLAVWVVTSGRLPLTGAEYKRPYKTKTGSSESHYKRGGTAMLSDRANIANQTEAEFDRCMKQDGCITRDPYLAKSVSLLSYLETSHPDILQAVLPLIDWNPVINFYILLEPYKTTGEYLIPDAAIFGANGWNGAETFTDAVTEYKRFFSMLGSQSGAAAYVLKDHAAVVQAVDLIRQQISSIQDKMSLPRAISTVYGQLESSNTIGGLSPVFPDATLALLRGGKKLWQDELRFIAQAAIQELYNAARSASGNAYSTDEWGAVVRMFRFERPGNDYAKEAGMIELVAMKGNVAPTADFYMLKKFANSTDLLYTPAPEGMIGGYMGSADDPTDMAVYNRNYEAHRSMARSRTRRTHGVSPQALTELRMYAAKHGGSLDGLLR